MVVLFKVIKKWAELILVTQEVEIINDRNWEHSLKIEMLAILANQKYFNRSWSKIINGF